MILISSLFSIGSHYFCRQVVKLCTKVEVLFSFGEESGWPMVFQINVLLCQSGGAQPKKANHQLVSPSLSSLFSYFSYFSYFSIFLFYFMNLTIKFQIYIYIYTYLIIFLN